MNHVGEGIFVDGKLVFVYRVPCDCDLRGYTAPKWVKLLVGDEKGPRAEHKVPTWFWLNRREHGNRAIRTGGHVFSFYPVKGAWR